MARTSRYSQEVRERAVRMVFEHRDEYDSEWEAIGSIAKKIGYTSETLRKWVRRAGPALRIIAGCCHVAVRRPPGAPGRARKCLESLEPTGGLEPPTC